MKTCLIISVLFVSLFRSAISSENCSDYLTDRLKPVKYDAFFEGFERKKTYNFEEVGFSVDKNSCIGGRIWKRSHNLRFNWSNRMGFLKLFEKGAFCLVYTFYRDEAGFLRMKDQLFSPLNAENFILGFYVEPETNRRVLYTGRTGGKYFSKHTLTGADPSVITDVSGSECNSSMLDLKLMPKSGGGKLGASGGAWLIVWSFLVGGLIRIGCV